MPTYHAARHYDIPEVDLLTLLFDHPKCLAKESTIIHLDAENPTQCLTKAQSRTWTRRIAHTLRHKYGIGSSGPNKDIVTCLCTGQILLPILFYGIIAAGGVYAGSNTATTASELARQMKEAESKLIVCSAEVVGVAIEAARMAGMGREKVLVLSSEGEMGLRGVDSGKSVVGAEEMGWEAITDRTRLEESLICLLYSAGTTGLPKGVRLSHWNCVSEVVVPAEGNREALQRLYAAGAPEFEYRTLAHLPAAHIAGVQGYIIRPFYAGGPCFWMARFDFTKFLEYCKRHRITFLASVPPIYLQIAKSEAVGDQLESVRFATSGAAPMGKSLQHAASAKLGKPPWKAWISQTFGMTETSGSVTIMPWDQKDDTGSISPLVGNTSLRIVDDDEHDVLEGQPGEMILKGPFITRGYFKNEDATREAFTGDGWFKTGDVAELRGGRLYVVDRKKEFIKYKGLQVAPAELEAYLIAHPLIADAAVIGIEGQATELPRAYVVADRTKLSEQQIKDYIKGKAAAYKQLRGGVVFVESIPKSASGKILRKELRARARKEGESRPKL